MRGRVIHDLESGEHTVDDNACRATALTIGRCNGDAHPSHARAAQVWSQTIPCKRAGA
jgi:hypothetical protein